MAKPLTADATHASNGPVAPDAAPTSLQRAIAAYRSGAEQAAVNLARAAASTAGPDDFSAHAVLGEVLHRAGRLDELQQFLDEAVAFRTDPRARLLFARLARRRGELQQADAGLAALLAEASLAPPLRRMAAFERVAVLQALGLHAESWRVAAHAHALALARHPFPTEKLVSALRVTAQASPAELARLPKATHSVNRSACILGLPRSGTTLLEQMLDRHPQISGVGEGPWPGRMADAMARAGGGWPGGALRAQPRMLDSMQQQYLDETRRHRNLPDAVWALDKTLFPMMQPLFIAGVLPGAKVLHLTRDARDNAVSLLLNNFDPSWGWTADLDDIRQVLAAERQYLPTILDKLKLDVLRLRYEDLVEQPEVRTRAALAHLGLAWEPACLQPQDNSRLVFTLSHEQVRRPLNREGMGRWQVHSEHFGAAWDGLV